jgi:hypothetical protein
MRNRITSYAAIVLAMTLSTSAQPTFLRRTLPVNQSDQSGAIPPPVDSVTKPVTPITPKASETLIAQPTPATTTEVTDAPITPVMIPPVTTSTKGEKVKEIGLFPTQTQKTQLEAEMYYKIDQAVDAIVREYGSPRIVRLVTNDESAKEEFRVKFGTQRKALEVERELAELTARRTALLADITQMQQTSDKINQSMFAARATLEKIELISMETTVAIDKARAQIKKSKNVETVANEIEDLQQQRQRLLAEVNSIKEELKAVKTKADKTRKALEGVR